MSINKMNEVSKNGINPASAFNSQDSSAQIIDQQSSPNNFSNMMEQLTSMRKNPSNGQNGQKGMSESEKLKGELAQIDGRIAQAKEKANDAQGVYDRVSQPGWGPDFQTKEAVRDKNKANQDLAELQAKRQEIASRLQQAEQQESLYKSIGLT